MRNKLKRRVIINDFTEFSSDEVLGMVGVVLAGGNVSQTGGVAHPCHCTTWKNGAMVICRPTNGGALSFTVDMQGVGA